MSRDERTEPTHIHVEADVRYWEDATVNGVEDVDGSHIPGRNGKTWIIAIELASGNVKNWPEGTVANIHYKVCDAGEYWLTDADGNRLAKWRGHYVPNDFLCHGDRGFGDYIIMSIGPDGQIADYTQPTIDWEDWDDV
ncbi:hypothetical protein [Filomicrobium sp.]|uniref:hypothetical protein n=1 Tax=Filomicrobium sp. TaxID=2024831 RepID=UPI00258FA138|nr:hypothetical protein [Filomicrobium sp.]MCV0371120.1 hypothetical protein [Filomicrobium sp.]